MDAFQQFCTHFKHYFPYFVKCMLPTSQIFGGVVTYEYQFLDLQNRILQQDSLAGRFLGKIFA